MKTVLTIAGSDSSGGAGIQADIKTMIMHGVYAMSAISALTAQNTMGVSSIMEVSPEFLKEQLVAIIEDIRPDAIKIGMVSSKELIKVIVEIIDKYELTNIVVDPVMVATSGAKLIKDDTINSLCNELIVRANLITPNIPEAQILVGYAITSKEEMELAGKELYQKYGCNVLLKGGHNLNDANDLLYSKGGKRWYLAKRINNSNTHGTGCTLSSAIACNLAKGYTLEQSVLFAKNYLSKALNMMLDLGHGSGPINHGLSLVGDYKEEI